MDEDVETAELLADVGDRGAAGLGITQVTRSACLDALTERREAGCIDVDAADTGAGLGEAIDEGAAQRPGSTRHEHSPACESQPISHRARSRGG